MNIKLLGCNRIVPKVRYKFSHYTEEWSLCQQHLPGVTYINIQTFRHPLHTQQLTTNCLRSPCLTKQNSTMAI